MVSAATTNTGDLVSMVQSKKTPKVSVCVITYNQEKYIRECLQSIVDQVTEFDFEVIVGEDCSTDGTRAIVEEFAKNYPEIVKPIYQKENIGGGVHNLLTVHRAATGEYVCHIDGDDLAYPGKLQKQADCLNRNNETVLVWHKVNVFNDQGDVIKILHSRLNEIVDVAAITKNDVLKYGMLGAYSSTMYRRSAGPDFHAMSGEILDYFIVVSILNSGSARRIEEILGGYRLNSLEKTLSKNKSLYFNNSLVRKLYCSNLTWFYLTDKKREVRDSIFLNAFFCFLVDVRFLRPTSIDFIILSARTFSFYALLSIPGYFKKALKLRGSS